MCCRRPNRSARRVPWRRRGPSVRAGSSSHDVSWSSVDGLGQIVEAGERGLGRRPEVVDRGSIGWRRRELGGRRRRGVGICRRRPGLQRVRRGPRGQWLHRARRRPQQVGRVVAAPIAVAALGLGGPRRAGLGSLEHDRDGQAARDQDQQGDQHAHHEHRQQGGDGHDHHAGDGLGLSTHSTTSATPWSFDGRCYLRFCIGTSPGL